MRSFIKSLELFSEHKGWQYKINITLSVLEVKGKARFITR